MDANTAALIGSGSAICGAAAVLVAQPVLKAKESEVITKMIRVMLLAPFLLILPWLMKRFGTTPLQTRVKAW